MILVHCTNIAGKHRHPAPQLSIANGCLCCSTEANINQSVPNWCANYFCKISQLKSDICFYGTKASTFFLELESHDRSHGKYLRKNFEGILVNKATKTSDILVKSICISCNMSIRTYSTLTHVQLMTNDELLAIFRTPAAAPCRRQKTGKDAFSDKWTCRWKEEPIMYQYIKLVIKKKTYRRSRDILHGNDSRLLLFTNPKNCEAFLEHASTASDIVFMKSFATCCWLVPETNKIGHVSGSHTEGFSNHKSRPIFNGIIDISIHAMRPTPGRPWV